jgi:protein-tyrosine phosphatase
MGNICRSPMAEAVFQDMVNREGLQDQFFVDSAGTGDWHAGSTAHPGTLEVLTRHHISYDGRARQVTRDDLDAFDYVLAMDQENLGFLLRYGRGATAEVRLFLSYAKEQGRVTRSEVPDPYMDGGYDRTYNLVQPGCAALLDHIRMAEKV